MILRYDGTTKIAEVTGVGEGSITSAKLANSAVTSDKIDWTTLKGAPILRNIAVSHDTPNGWKSVMKGLSGQEAGHAIIWYTETGKFSTQPSQYGFCEAFWADGSDVALVWHQQNNGDWFWRSGNADGWSAAWRNGVNDLYYRPGETITEDLRGFGYVTSSAKDIFLTFPMGGKSLVLINSATINSGNMSIRCDNKYAMSEESIRNYATSLSVNPRLGVLTLHINKSSGFGVTNNSAVAAQGLLSITFNG